VLVDAAEIADVVVHGVVSGGRERLPIAAAERDAAVADARAPFLPLLGLSTPQW